MWSFPTSGLLYSSPAVADGLVFIASWDGNVYAIDEFSGARKWVFSSYQYVSSSPAVSNGLVYFTTACPTAGSGPFTCLTGSAYALDEQTGGVVWRLIAEPMTSSPLLADGRVFYGSIKVGNGHLYARYASNGNGNWTQPLTDAVESSPSVDNGRVFVGQIDGAVVALNENTGAQIWRVVPGDNVQTALGVGNGMVFDSTASTGLVALKENTGATVWTFPTGGLNVTSVSLNAGRVYFGTGSGTVYSLNATTGVQIWSRALGGAIASSPVLALGSGTLYIGSNDHRLYSLSMATGTILWSYLTPSNVVSSPAVADGRVFFGSQDQSVYALGVIAPKLQATISASPTSLKLGDISVLTMTVKNGTTPVSGASLTLTSSSGGTFTQPSMTSPGVYTCNFTAATVASSTNTTITVVAGKSGFVSGSAQTSIMVNPLPTLTVAVVPSPPSVSPGRNIVLDISVSNGTQMISGANITLSSSGGGSFSTPSDSGNGKYKAVFSTPSQSSNPTITVQASKAGFSVGQSQVTVTISGFPDLITTKVVGVPLLFLLLGLAALSIMIVVALARRHTTEPFVKPEPVVPSYALGHGSFPGRLN
jgi:outer membrane protein assembly factor BamB